MKLKNNKSYIKLNSQITRYNFIKFHNFKYGDILIYFTVSIEILKWV